MDVVKFTETVFSSKGKSGNIAPDKDGYYTVILGALNTDNSAGEYYTAEGVLELFQESSQLMRRIKNGALYAELGHPKKQPGMSTEQFYNRVLTIEETNICAHIAEVTLDFNFGKNHPELNNPKLIAIIGKVRPAGAKAQAVQIALENPRQNCAFSIRGLTENKYISGKTLRRLTNIICWDHVPEPGISIADKVWSPACEQRVISTEGRVTELVDTVVDKELMIKVLSNNLSTIGMESSYGMFNDILKSLKQKETVNRLSGW